MGDPHIQKSKAVIMIGLTMLLLCSKMETLAQDDFLITRIVDADTPEVTFFKYSDHNLTIFLFPMIIEIENPTINNITVTYGCSLFPFPQLTTRLANKSQEVFLAFSFEWSVGTYDYVPGVKRDNYSFEMMLYNYPEETETLPMGEYELWFDFTNCSSVPVSVVYQKMTINVSETDMTYFYEYDNSTEIFDISQTVEIPTTETSLNQLVALLLLISNTLLMKLRKKKLRL
ncbi:hypothetical protein EU534_01355 [Candidatus Heimdallarchaeota archaeon]|nr:MAG: hypothetical protein EU534_01355 [Candidatus Heimdallarchaeota archaeon]